MSTAMPVELIAEIAQGFEGDPALARRLARAAVQAGADAVKYQLVIADELATPEYRYYALFRALEMSEAAWRDAAAEVHAAGRRLYFDVFGPESLALALRVGAVGVKIHSADFFNDRLVAAALAQAPHLFVSLGGIRAEEVEAFVGRHGLTPASRVTFLYGFQADPTPVEMTQLRRLAAWQRRLPGFAFGFMDHVEGDRPEALTLALLALPYGIRCIEKHFTLDRALQLEDYVSALGPREFHAFAQAVRAHAQALGEESLSLTPAEVGYREKALKTVVAARALKAGELLDQAALALKRSGRPVQEGAALRRLEEATGRRLLAALEPDQPLTREMIR